MYHSKSGDLAIWFLNKIIHHFVPELYSSHVACKLYKH